MAAVAARYSIGLDFGTESVRVVVVDIADGRIAAQASSDYAHGVMDGALVVKDAQIRCRRTTHCNTRRIGSTALARRVGQR
jgi:ribulose kinase